MSDPSKTGITGGCEVPSLFGLTGVRESVFRCSVLQILI